MALGYEGYVKLNDKFALGTGGGVPRARQRIESSAGYGGEIDNSSGNMGIGSPHTYDWTVWDGSLDFEAHDSFLSDVVSWIFDRQSSRKAEFSTRSDNIQTFDNCYWNNISLSTSEGSLVTGSVGFVAVDRSSYTRGGDTYPADSTGADLSDYSVYFRDIQPIPYWWTKVRDNINDKTLEFTNWTIDFSQDVVKFFACEGFEGPQAPKYLAVGPLSVTFSGDYLPVGGLFMHDNTDEMFNSPEGIKELNIVISNTTIKLRKLELTTDEDVLQGQDSTTPISVDYTVYELEQ